jgi:hypothetical protein
LSKRVLIIAPEMGLNALAEVINAASGFLPEILHGTVTRGRALKEISSGDYEIVLFITHATEHVLRVTDGIIEENLLELAIAQSNSVQVLFLNACRTAHTSAAIYNNTDVTYTIGWPSDVSNDLAFTWSRLFFDALRINPNDVRRAANAASDAVVRSHKISPDELPILLNGRNMALKQDNIRLQEQIAIYNQGAMRIPNWMIVVNAVIVTLLIVNTLVLTSLS